MNIVSIVGACPNSSRRRRWEEPCEARTIGMCWYIPASIMTTRCQPYSSLRPEIPNPNYQLLGYRSGDLPASEGAVDRVFSLPTHPYLSAAAQQRIVDAFFRASRGC